MNETYIVYKDLWKIIKQKMYDKISIRENFKLVIGDIELIQYLGGIIAGGFVENLIYTYLISDHPKKMMHILKYVTNRDIDIFFDNEQLFNANKEILTLKFKDKSISTPYKNAETFYVNYCKVSELTCKFQLVNCVFGSYEKILDSFDLTNCKAAIVQDDIIVHKDLLKLIQNKLIDLTYINSNKYLSRVAKYLEKYDTYTEEKRFTDISDKTIELISKNFRSDCISLSVFPTKKTFNNREVVLLTVQKFIYYFEQIFTNISKESSEKLYKNIFNEDSFINSKDDNENILNRLKQSCISGSCTHHHLSYSLYDSY